MGAIFINYRRDDSAAFAGRIFDRLEMEFGREAVFLDVDTIPAGADFRIIIQRHQERCDVLLALIGPRWIARSRLHDPKDVVRIEIETALERGILVIPILLEGARMPRSDELPAGLDQLRYKQSLDVSHASFDPDMDGLVHSLRGFRRSVVGKVGRQ